MKKSTKIILITSACLIFGGLLIAIVSGTVGGTKQFKELADRQQLTFDIPLEDAKLHLNTSGLYFTTEEESAPEERPFDEPEAAETAEEPLAEEADEIKNIEMELGAGEIELRKSGNGTFHVGESENIRVTSDIRGETLKIKAGFEGSVQIFGFSTGSASVGSAVIYLPDRVYESIKIEMGAGVCTGEMPECEELSMNLGAGEMDFAQLKADEMELEVGAGECKIGLLEFGKLDADIAMGEFTAKAAIGSELDATVGMGEIEMEIIGEESDFDYDVEVGAGEVRIGSRT